MVSVVTEKLEREKFLNPTLGTRRAVRQRAAKYRHDDEIQQSTFPASGRCIKANRVQRLLKLFSFLAVDPDGR